MNKEKVLVLKLTLGAHEINEVFLRFPDIILNLRNIFIMNMSKYIITIFVVVVSLNMPARSQQGELKNSLGITVSGGYYNLFYLKDKYNYLDKGKTAIFGVNYSRLISEHFQFVSGIRLIKSIDRLESVCPYCSLPGEYADISLISVPLIIKYHIISGFYISAGFNYHISTRSIKNIIHSENKLRRLDNSTRLGFELSISKEIRLADKYFISIEPQLILLTFSDYLFDNKSLYEENYAGLNLSVHRKFNFKKRLTENMQ